MALIKCPECGKEISDRADKCINCGYPIHKQNELTKDAIKTKYKKSINVGTGFNNRILAINNLDRIMLWCAVGLLFIVLFIVTVTFRNKPVICGMQIGMSKDEVTESEPDYYEFEKVNVISVDASDVFGEEGTVWYEFDEEDKLMIISFMADSSSYIDFSNMFCNIVEKYGYPDACFGRLDSSKDDIQRFYWNVGNETIQLFYAGHDPMFVTELEDIDRSDEITIRFKKHKTCSVDGCHKKAQAWSGYCDYHGCGIIGCENPADDNMDGMYICKQHGVMVYNGEIDID